MTRFRIWLARKILGQHGVIRRPLPKTVMVKGTQYPVIGGNTFAGSHWTNSPE